MYSCPLVILQYSLNRINSIWPPVSVKGSITVVCFVPGEIEPCILTGGSLKAVAIFRRFRRPDCGDGAKRCNQEKQRGVGGGVGVRAKELSLSSYLFFPAL